MVLGLAGDTAWVDAGFLPMMDRENDFSWAFWARQDPDQASPANDIILGNRYDQFGADTSPREFIKFTPNRFEYQMNGGFRNDLQYAPVDIPSNDRWIHHSVVKEGDSLTYYRNGEIASEGAVVDPMFSLDPLPFAMAGQNDVEVWRGCLSDVRLYDNALTQTEINEIMGGDGGDGPSLRAGDANRDLQFDQLDLVQVQVAGKYLTSEPATWGEGDWNGAPGGSPADPPPGDGLFNQLDIIAALAEEIYLTGPYAAAAGPEGTGAGKATLDSHYAPEPHSIMLLGLGLAGARLTRRRRRP
jgi:hypothetical protein